MPSNVMKSPSLALLIGLLVMTGGAPPARASGLDDYCPTAAQRAAVHTFGAAVPWNSTGSHGLSPDETSQLLQQDGITLTADPPGSVRLFDDRAVYAGGATSGLTGSGYRIHDVLLQIVQGPVSYTLSLDPPVRSFGFVRASLIAGSNGITSPAWTATAYDSDGNVVASTREAEIRSYRNVPARPFILSGQGRIRSVVFSADNHHFDAFANIVVSDIAWCR